MCTIFSNNYLLVRIQILVWTLPLNKQGCQVFLWAKGHLEESPLDTDRCPELGIWEQKADTVLRLTTEAEANPEHA